MHMGRSTQLAFPLGALFGENMTLERLAALERATPRLPEALSCAPVGLDFWHLFAPKKIK
jgi:hypothetical protein